MKSRMSGLCLALAVSFGVIGAAWLKAQDFGFRQLSRTNKEAVLNLTNLSNGAYDILVSTNTMDWNALVTALSTNGSIQHTDSATPFLDRRYYRGLQLTNSNVVTGDHIPTDAGDVVIHPRGHADLVLSWSNRFIYFDPVTNSQYLAPADLVLLTHGHTDHLNNTAINTVSYSNTFLVSSLWAYSNLNSTLKTKAIVLTNGVTTNLLGIGIEAFPMYNLLTSNHPKNSGGNGYILTIGGKRIYVCGDTEDTPEMCALTNIDLAFLAMNSFTLKVTQAVHAVRAFVPQVVYPFHYSGTPVSDLVNFKQQMLTNPCVEVRLRKWY